MIEITPKFNLFNIVAAIGAIVMIVGVFLSWVDLSGAVSQSVMGWDISTQSAYSGTAYSYVPMTVLACGIVFLALAIISMIGMTTKWDMVLSLIGVAVSVAALILVILFNGDIGSSFGTATVDAVTGMGVWVSLVGSVVAAACGAMEAFKDLA